MHVVRLPQIALCGSPLRAPEVAAVAVRRRLALPHHRAGARRQGQPARTCAGALLRAIKTHIRPSTAMADLGLGLTGTTMTKSSSNGGSRGLPGSVASHLTGGSGALGVGERYSLCGQFIIGRDGQWRCRGAAAAGDVPGGDEGIGRVAGPGQPLPFWDESRVLIGEAMRSPVKKETADQRKARQRDTLSRPRAQAAAKGAKEDGMATLSSHVQKLKVSTLRL